MSLNPAERSGELGPRRLSAAQRRVGRDQCRHGAAGDAVLNNGQGGDDRAARLCLDRDDPPQTQPVTGPRCALGGARRAYAPEVGSVGGEPEDQQAAVMPRHRPALVCSKRCARGQDMAFLRRRGRADGVPAAIKSGEQALSAEQRDGARAEAGVEQVDVGDHPVLVRQQLPSVHPVSLPDPPPPGWGAVDNPGPVTTFTDESTQRQATRRSVHPGSRDLTQRRVMPRGAVSRGGRRRSTSARPRPARSCA